MPYEYLLALVIIFLISLAVSFKFKLKIFNNFKQLILFYIILIPIAIAWDNIAVVRGHWLYPGRGILGIFLGYVPIEDYLFVIVCGYNALVLYKLTDKLLKK